VSSSDLVKIVAIVSLTVLESINLVTAKIDGAILILVSSIIGGLAGYEIGRLTGRRR
jgi:hypothetical protein